LIARSTVYLSKKIVGDLSSVIGVDQTKGIKTPTLSVAGAVGGILGQVVLHQGQGVLHLTAVDHAQAGGGRELGPRAFEIALPNKSLGSNFHLERCGIVA